jgi:hypothetical protein
MRIQRRHPHSIPQPGPVKIGIDIGRVIINGEGGNDTSFFGHDDQAAMATPGVPGAFEAITELVDAFEQRAWLVSKCGPKIQRRSMLWLDHHGFWAATGLSRANVRFCLERRDKAQHATKLGLTHFVDDRWDVHTHLAGLVEHLYLFGPQPRRDHASLPGLVHTRTWDDVLGAALPTTR